MGERTVSDLGFGSTAIHFETAPGSPLRCAVMVRDSTGVQTDVPVPIAGTLTPEEEAALPALLEKLYAAATTSLGFE